MKFQWLRFILISILIVLIQSFVLNNILFSSYINPYLYTLLLILLPLKMNKSVTLLYGFGLGLIIDIMSNTPGWHAGASVFAVFARNVLLNIAKPMEAHDDEDVVTIFSLGFTNYLLFAGAIVLIHHSYLFLIESFQWRMFWASISKAFLSAVITMILIILSQYLFLKKSSR